MSTPVNNTKGPEQPGYIPAIYNWVTKSLGGVGDGLSTISQYETVKTVRGSAIWYYITWIPSAIGSLLGGIWARFSRLVWGSPISTKDFVEFQIKGYIWNKDYNMSPVDAVRNKYLTTQELVADHGFTEDQIRILGLVTVIIKGTLYNGQKLLRDAVEGKLMTIEEAIDAQYITQKQADEAAKQGIWLKKTTDNK